MKEVDLYEPCKNLLEEQGFQVKAEVHSCDIMAVKDDYIVMIELKLGISLKLVYQAIDRQKLADKVYVALPSTAINSNRANLKNFINLLKRLELGLISVNMDKAEIIVETFGFDLKKSVSASKKKKERLLKEFTLRKSDQNLGGSKGKKMTAYKERVIEIAKYLDEFGEKSPKEIMMYTGIKDTPNILRKNYYLWFINVKRGIYRLSEIGKRDLNELKEREDLY